MSKKEDEVNKKGHQNEKENFMQMLQNKTEQLAKKNARVQLLENDLRDVKEALSQSEMEKDQLKIYSLQPNATSGQPNSQVKDEKQLKVQMREFLQELLKGKKMKLVT